MKPGLLASLALVLASCAKTEADWVRDLRDPNAHTRLFAVVALGSKELDLERPDVALSELRLRTNIDPSHRVRAYARRALDVRAGEDVAALLAAVCRESPDIDAGRQFLTLGEEGAMILGNALRGPGCGNKAFVARILAELGEVALPQLVSALKQDDLAIQRAALGALAHMGPRAKSVLPALERYAGIVREELRGDLERTLEAVRGGG